MEAQILCFPSQHLWNFGKFLGNFDLLGRHCALALPEQVFAIIKYLIALFAIKDLPLDIR